MKRAAVARVVMVGVLCVAALGAALLLPEGDPTNEVSTTAEVRAAEPPPDPAPVAMLAVLESARRPIVTSDESPLDVAESAPATPVAAGSGSKDKLTAELRERIQSLDAECHRLKWQLHECQKPLEPKECIQLAREYDEFRFPERTPTGALIRLPEYAELSAKDRQEIQEVLADYPVLLRSGEAAWIAERWRQNDWHMYGRDVREALVLFLGPARVAAEMPLDKFEELRQRCDDAEWARLFGSR